MNKLKKLLLLECTYQLPDEIMDCFLAKMTVCDIRKGSAIIDTGCINPDIFIVKEGIFSYNYLNGTDERCWGFAMPGTMMYSSHSYYYGEPAFYRVEACCDSTVLHCKKKDFDSLVSGSHEFAQWALSMAQCQLYFFERKNSVINGNASERFMSLVRNRPEILEKVTMKTIASYLGITQQYLSCLKRKKSL